VKKANDNAKKKSKHFFINDVLKCPINNGTIAVPDVQ
jgi:hypothetical protein